MECWLIVVSLHFLYISVLSYFYPLPFYSSEHSATPNGSSDNYLETPKPTETSRRYHLPTVHHKGNMCMLHLITRKGNKAENHLRVTLSATFRKHDDGLQTVCRKSFIQKQKKANVKFWWKNMQIIWKILVWLFNSVAEESMKLI